MVSKLAVAVSAATLLTIGQASTSFGCWSDQSNHFHKDCSMAFTTLVTQLTGPDSIALIPASAVQNTYNGCTATIKGSGNQVGATDLLGSFDELGARCQNGWFFYDNGWLNGQIQGHAGWKKREAESGAELPNIEESISQWANEGNVTDYAAIVAEKREEKVAAPGLERRNGVLTKRVQGEYVQSLYTNSRAFAMYRATHLVIADVTPRLQGIATTLSEWTEDMFYAVSTSATSELIRTGVEGTSGSTVDSVVMVAQLGGADGANTWKGLFNYFGDGTDTVNDFAAAAALDWGTNGFLASVYHIYDLHDTSTVLVSFVINGLQGVVTSLPSK